MPSMNDLIRRAAGVTQLPRVRWDDDIDDDDAQALLADPDQGQRDIPAAPPISAEMNTRIRRAAGISIRPGQRTDIPEIEDY